MGLRKDIKKLSDALINGENPDGLDSRYPEISELGSIIAKKLEHYESKLKLAEQRVKDHKMFLAENEMLQSDRVVAEQIQQSMLEKRYPAFEDVANIDLFADMDSTKEVGGDFYDYFKIDDRHICFSVADVEGKGVAGAMYMAVAKSLIRMRLESGENPADVLYSVNQQLCSGSMQKRFISIWVGILDITDGTLRYVNAGHNFPIIKKKGAAACFVENRSGIPLASYYSKKKTMPAYTLFETQLQKGDTLVLYTDGASEAMNVDGELYGEKRLLENVDIYADGHNVQELCSYLKRRILGFCERSEQADDITMLALRML